MSPYFLPCPWVFKNIEPALKGRKLRAHAGTSSGVAWHRVAGYELRRGVSSAWANSEEEATPPGHRVGRGVELRHGVMKMKKRLGEKK
jgi:hypothetical protein